MERMKKTTPIVIILAFAVANCSRTEKQKPDGSDAGAPSKAAMERNFADGDFPGNGLAFSDDDAKKDGGPASSSRDLDERSEEWRQSGDPPPDEAMLKAVVRGDLEALADYIEAGGNLNARSPSGSTILNTSVVYGHPDAFHALVEAGADVHLTDHKGYTALHTAVFFGQTEMVKGLLDAGINPYQQSNEGHRPFGAVRATFEQMRPHYDRIGGQLEANNGILLDYDKIRASREPIKRLLEESGAP